MYTLICYIIRVVRTSVCGEVLHKVQRFQSYFGDFISMLSGHVMSMSHSQSFGVLSSKSFYTQSDRTIRKNTNLFLTMGPVSTAVILFIAEKAVSRAAKGQLLRKGVIRKIRRLTTMILEWNVVFTVLCDIIDDILQ